METQIISNMEQAKTIAELIVKEVGKDFFTIDEMRKKLVKTNGKFLKKISWSEARNYTDFLTKYGFCEVQLTDLAANAKYRIRLDIEFRKQAYQKQKETYEQRISEINIVLSLLDKEHENHSPAKKAAKKAVKKSPMKVVKKSVKK